MNRNLILSTIYDRLQSEGVAFACIGDPFYANDAESGDIDFLVDRKDLQRASNLIKEELDNVPELLTLSVKSPSPTAKHSLKFLSAVASLDREILQIDLFTSFHWRGFYTLSYQGIRPLIQTGTPPTIGGKAACCVGALKDLVYGKPVKAKRYDQGYSEEALKDFLPSVDFSQTAAAKFVASRGKRNKGALPFLRLWLSSFGSRRLAHLLLYALGIVRLYGPFVRRQYVVAFYGPDGAGKSSIISEMTKCPLLQEYFASIHLKHTRPNLLPAISKVLNPTKSLTKILEGKPNRSIVPVTKAKACINAAYYSLDYALGRLADVFKRFDRKRTLTVFDRYAFEYAYQQTFANLPGPMVRWVALCQKRPDLNIFAHASPEIIEKRKGELSKSEIEYQVERFKKADQKFHLGSIFIDTSHCSPAECGQRAVSEIVKAIR